MELCVLDARTVRRVIPSFGELACHFRSREGEGCEDVGAGHDRATRLFELEDSDCAWTPVTVSLWLSRRAEAREGLGGLAGLQLWWGVHYGFWRGRGKNHEHH